jgi:2-iminobutanoate/2-iminopropanoate deaminase
MKKETILGRPGAPYAKAVKAGAFLFVSGNVAVNPETGQVPEGGIEAQTRQVLDNLKATVEELGSSFDDVVKVNVYLVNMDHFGGMNAVYKEYFPDPPTRTTVGINALARKEFLIEIDLIAVL